MTRESGSTASPAGSCSRDWSFKGLKQPQHVGSCREVGTMQMSLRDDVKTLKVERQSHFQAELQLVGLFLRWWGVLCVFLAAE